MNQPNQPAQPQQSNQVARTGFQGQPPAAQPQSRAISPIEDFARSLKVSEGQFKPLLPAHVPFEKFTQIVCSALAKNPGLLQYDRASLFTACVDAAKDGLMPDGKEGALVPFKGKVVYQPMVGGILKKIRNSGELSSINPQIIRSNDTFDYYIDEKGPHLMHRPNFQNPGEMTGTYTLAVMKDGGIYLEVMTKEQVDKIRARSPSGTSGPWVSDYEEMAKKTGLKRLSKRLPMSTDIESFFGQDDEVDAITEQTQAVHQVASTAETATPVQAASASAPGVVQGPSKLKSALKAKEPLPPAQEIIQTTATPILTNREDPGPMDFNDPNLPL